MRAIRLKRVYDPVEPGDGKRILIDGIWPRGVRKDSGAVDLWLREVAPSAELRRWYGHDPARWSEFRTRYHAELEDRPTEVDRLQGELASGPATLVFATKAEDLSNARALREYLERRRRLRGTAG